MSEFNVEWSAASLKKMEKIAELANIDITRHNAWISATFRVGEDLRKNIEKQAESKFSNGDGTLASSFETMGRGDGSMEVGSELPYARRREFGFSGRTDSRGRYFADDPGQIYVMEAIADTHPLIRARYARALSLILGTAEEGITEDYMG